MIVYKILNNNLIMTRDEHRIEQIVMGKGLRFINQVGEKHNHENIQKVFIVKDDRIAQQYLRLLADINDSSAEIIQEALQLVYEAYPR